MQPSILLVDDDPIGAELTMAALAELQLGLPVQLAVDGEEALDLLMRRKPMDPGAGCPPYLVLLDLKMPKIDGHEVLRQIRENDQLRSLRVIVLTSSDQKSDMERSRELGTDAYLLKPPSIFDLIDEFRKLGPLFQPPTRFTC